MSISDAPENQPAAEPTESFDEIFAAFEKSHARKPEDRGKQIEATVISVKPDAVILDIGFKTEGSLPTADLRADETVKPGDKMLVSVKGRDPEGFYNVSRIKVVQPTDWSTLEKAFAEKSTIVGRVTGVIKGGLSVDVGVRAFMPASRSGVRDAAEMAKLVDEEIRCRIIKLDVADEDVVVDRRVIGEEEERANKDRRYSEMKEGDTVHGTVRSLADYGAFVDIGGADALLHVGEISWSRVAKPSDVLTVGDAVEAKIIKIDAEKQRISISVKQLQPHPWDALAEKYKVGDRIRGNVTRVAEFGAFVELEPGVEGLIHVSEMSWGKKVRIASDIVKPGETVDAIILSVSIPERRISLGLKQALGDPWANAAERFVAGNIVEGPVTRLAPFGAFIQLAEGVDGLVHISEISADKRINHPQDVLKVGQVVQAQILAVDTEKRQLKLSMKQLVPTGLDEYMEEHKVGDTVTGRIIDVTGSQARVELGQGITAKCTISTPVAAKEETADAAKADLSSLTSMLQSRWKNGPSASATKAQGVATGQIHSFKITKLDAEGKKIELEQA